MYNIKRLLFLAIIPLMAILLFSCIKVNHTHDYIGSWQHNLTHHWHVCECGEESDKELHTWDAGIITTAPTILASGIKTFKCNICLRTKDVEAPYLSNPQDVLDNIFHASNMANSNYSAEVYENGALANEFFLDFGTFHLINWFGDPADNEVYGMLLDSETNSYDMFYKNHYGALWSYYIQNKDFDGYNNPFIEHNSIIVDFIPTNNEEWEEIGSFNFYHERDYYVIYLCLDCDEIYLRIQIYDDPENTILSKTIECLIYFIGTTELIIPYSVAFGGVEILMNLLYSNANFSTEISYYAKINVTTQGWIWGHEENNDLLQYILLTQEIESGGSHTIDSDEAFIFKGNTQNQIITRSCYGGTWTPWDSSLGSSYLFTQSLTQDFYHPSYGFVTDFYLEGNTYAFDIYYSATEFGFINVTFFENYVNIYIEKTNSGFPTIGSIDITFGTSELNFEMVPILNYEFTTIAAFPFTTTLLFSNAKYFNRTFPAPCFLFMFELTATTKLSFSSTSSAYFHLSSGYFFDVFIEGGYGFTITLSPGRYYLSIDNDGVLSSANISITIVP